MNTARVLKSLRIAGGFRLLILSSVLFAAPFFCNGIGGLAIAEQVKSVDVAALLRMDDYERAYVTNAYIEEADFGFVIDRMPAWNIRDLSQEGKNFIVAFSPEKYLPTMRIKAMPHPDMVTDSRELKKIAEVATQMAFKQFRGSAGSESKLVYATYDYMKGYLYGFKGVSQSGEPMEIVVFVGMGVEHKQVVAFHFEVHNAPAIRARSTIIRVLKNSGYIKDFPAQRARTYRRMLEE